jgi:predicted transcriptional regulator
MKGFFAGEGNIKFLIKYSTRTIRIAQGKKVDFLEKTLNNLNISYNYSIRERAYVINNKKNWDKFAKISLAELHPLKNKQFWETYESYKQEHYEKNYLKKEIYNFLITTITSSNIAHKFNRSQARIQDILIDLKKENKIKNFRIKSKDYWIRIDQNKIIISRLKNQYLKLLNQGYNKTYEFANYFKVDHKSSYKRLKELEKLGLIKRNINKEWIKLNTDKEIVVI